MDTVKVLCVFQSKPSAVKAAAELGMGGRPVKVRECSYGSSFQFVRYEVVELIEA